MTSDSELEQLRARVAHLESLVERLTISPTATRQLSTDASAPVPPDGFSRRRMLRNGLGLSAAAVAGLGTVDALGSSAAADDGDSVTVGQTVSPSSATSNATGILNPAGPSLSTALFRVDNVIGTPLAPADDFRAAIVATVSGQETAGGLPVDHPQAAIVGLSQRGTAVQAQSTNGYGVVAISENGTAVSATSTAENAVDAITEFGIGVNAVSNGMAVKATATVGDGVFARSDSGYGVNAKTQTGDGAVIGVHAGSGFGVIGDSNEGTGLGGGGKTGVLAVGTTSGVDATSAAGIAVKASSTSGTAVQATSSSGTAVSGTGPTGVIGTATGSGSGVHGTSDAGSGVVAQTETGWGLQATSTSGLAVRAESQTGAAVSAETGGTTAAVAASNTAAGPGARATSATGIGAIFQGGAAAVRLVPRAVKGHPTAGSHQRGELVVDHGGALWICTKPGTPGIWKQLAFA